jgi:hypothetical protein
MLTKMDLIKIGSVVEGRFDVKVKEYKDEVLGFKEEVLGEIQKLRDEVVITGHHYKKTNERVDKIDEHLGINTSVIF